MQSSRTLRMQLPQPKEETTHGHGPAGRLDGEHTDHQRELGRQNGDKACSHDPRPMQPGSGPLQGRSSSSRGRGFSGHLTSSALVRALSTRSVNLSNCRSMTIRIYLNSLFKRAETSALLDSGATENFINPDYTRELKLPVEELVEPRKVFNVDRTQNRHRQITHHTDLEVRTGDQMRTMHFFLTNLGKQKVILGYPWFAAVQPIVDWAKGWIAYKQLPVVIKARI
jgi:hypothetical protein